MKTLFLITATLFNISVFAQPKIVCNPVDIIDGVMEDQIIEIYGKRAAFQGLWHMDKTWYEATSSEGQGAPMTDPSKPSKTLYESSDNGFAVQIEYLPWANQTLTISPIRGILYVYDNEVVEFSEDNRSNLELSCRFVDELTYLDK